METLDWNSRQAGKSNRLNHLNQLFLGVFWNPKIEKGEEPKKSRVQTFSEKMLSLYNNLHWSPERVYGGIHTFCGRTFKLVKKMI